MADEGYFCRDVVYRVYYEITVVNQVLVIVRFTEEAIVNVDGYPGIYLPASVGSRKYFPLTDVGCR